MAEYIKRILAKAEFTGNFQNEYPVGQIHALIDCVPAADVRENVKGKWVFKKGDMVTCDDGWYCSHCKRGFHTNVPYFKDFNFCPNCGANMREAQDDKS